jgi:hypothetical protein
MSIDLRESCLLLWIPYFCVLQEAAFIHLAENEREDNRQRVNAIQLTVKQMEESYVDGERKRRELQHVMDSMFSRSAYTALYRNNEKKKILLARAEAQLRVKLMAPDWAPLQLDNAGPLPAAKSDKMKKIVAAIAGGKRNAVSANPQEEVPAGTKVFNGLGEGRDLPRYLRSSAPVQHQSLHLQETQSLIKQFWSQVASASVASSGASIHDFLNSFFGKRNSGASTDSVSLAYSLILAAQKYSEDDVFIELFWKIWSGTWRYIFALLLESIANCMRVNHSNFFVTNCIFFSFHEQRRGFHSSTSHLGRFRTFSYFKKERGKWIDGN